MAEQHRNPRESRSQSPYDGYITFGPWNPGDSLLRVEATFRKRKGDAPLDEGTVIFKVDGDTIAPEQERSFRITDGTATYIYQVPPNPSKVKFEAIQKRSTPYQGQAQPREGFSG
ncbi:MAG: hypothetical protein KW793_04005 [Candidatus Doudnabacteria bacterium]|nr:hypothetical protein [Candidatus Doudnabacteria bacterium]